MNANPFYRSILYFLKRNSPKKKKKKKKSIFEKIRKSQLHWPNVAIFSGGIGPTKRYFTRPNSCLVSYRTIWLSPGNTSRPRDTCVNPFCPTGDTGWWRAHCHSKIAPKAMPVVVVGTNRRGAHGYIKAGVELGTVVTNGSRGHPRECTNVIMKRRPKTSCAA